MFDAPGPGSWVLDTTHFTGPVTRFTRELFPEPVERGFRDGTRPYGILLDHIAWGFVDHWPYLSPRPVPDVEGAADVRTPAEWHRLVAASPALSERLATAAAVFPAKAWRADLARWDEEVKPAAIREHDELGRVDPDGLTGGDLTAHLARCRDNLKRSLYRHHRFNVAAVIAVGDFLVHMERWSGRTGPEVLGALRGVSPGFLGAANGLEAVAEALRRDAEARAVLHGPDAGVVITELLERPGAVGDALGRYVERAGNWPVGSGADVADPRLAEVPEVLVRHLAAAVEEGSGEGAGDDLAADLRRGVPAAHRAAYDDLLTEAKASYRLRDERATFCDVWAFGLMRRALVAAGGRLAERGTLSDPRHLIEAGQAEVWALVDGDGGVDGDELEERARARAEATFADAPPFLGPPPRPPVPVAWLAPGAARTEEAFRAYVAAMAAGEDPETGDDPGDPVRGIGASPGSHEGTARLVDGPDDLSDVRDGDVLVARATSPAFNVVVPFVGAIVTDSGGLLSHAAIVAREYGIPAVVGTTDATRRIPSGATVLVDGDRGEVSVRT